MSEQDYNKLNERLFTIEKDVYSISSLVDKLDATFDKISEVSNSLSKLIAVHDNEIISQSKRLDKIESTMEKLLDGLEKRRTLVDEEINKSNQRINDLRSDMKDEISDNYNEFVKVMKDFKTENMAVLNQMEKDIKRIDKFTWLIIGGLVVLEFILSFGTDFFQFIGR